MHANYLQSNQRLALKLRGQAMEQQTGRLYEFVVFGATGYAGRFVVEKLAQVLEKETSTVYRWAVAGRSRERLLKVVSRLPCKLGKPKPSVGTIVCDVNDPDSVEKMCKQTLLLMNCVGPYWLLGEPVVKACIKNGTNYIDICGEPKFLEEMYMKYNKEAAENGVHVVGSSGFSSIPADMGVIYTQNEVDGIITTIESFWYPKLTGKGIGINRTAWQAAIHGLQFKHHLKKLRKQTSLEPIPFMDKTVKRNVHYCKEYNYVAIPFIGADASVVRRTQRYLYEHHQKTPVHYVSYSVVSGFVSALLLLFAGFLITLLAKIKCGRRLLLKYPDFFSCSAFSDEGPTQRGIKETSFQMRFISKGYSMDKDPVYDIPNMVAYTSVEGPEPAYVTTSIAMVQAAVTMIEEQKLLPKGGGVFTPGAAFAQTSLLDRLTESGLTFSVQKTTTKD
uniref:Saccharopine dehydrogenase-like oxidoreductase n=1 Tax=Leptobrachium leishanense TaxID=445787 RepID=A0A8C5MK92_9ANUR